MVPHETRVSEKSRNGQNAERHKRWQRTYHQSLRLVSGGLCRTIAHDDPARHTENLQPHHTAENDGPQRANFAAKLTRILIVWVCECVCVAMWRLPCADCFTIPYHVSWRTVFRQPLARSLACMWVSLYSTQTCGRGWDGETGAIITRMRGEKCARRTNGLQVRCERLSNLMERELGIFS